VSLFQFIDYCCGHGGVEAQQNSSAVRKLKVDTAARKLDERVDECHAASAALKTSSQLFSESSKRVVECLICPARAMDGDSASDKDMP
jgi:hypothetical protein